jgi:glycosyltransferase involved in cell wall biosynthesis
MYKNTEGNFRFVATEPFMQERLQMGFEDRSDKFTYVIKSYESDHNYKEALKLGYESDVVIIGSAPDEFIRERLKDNKLTFRYCERFFKDGRWRIFDPRVLKARYKMDFQCRNKELYMLCASAYTAPDCRFIFSYPKKTYRWGYFPEVKTYDNLETLINLKEKYSILWAGRFLDWKHPKSSLEVAKYLHDKGYNFEMNIIGRGELENKIRAYIDKNRLDEKVHLLGTMSPEKVREYMEKSDIFLFTSDRNEGWGAVLNESMNSACAVIANKEIGSVPYLIEDGKNGIIYNRKIKNDLSKKVEMLFKNADLKQKIQKNAYETMKNVWNAEIASERLLNLIDCINRGEKTGYISGPCSEDF